MKSNFILVVVLFISFMSIISGSASAEPLEVARVLPASTSLGQEFEVTLNINVDETTKPESYILYETVPAGFEVTGHEGMSYNAGNRQLKLVGVESSYYGTKIVSHSIIYTVKSASSQNGAFSGSVRYDNQNHDITGDNKISLSTALPEDTKESASDITNNDNNNNAGSTGSTNNANAENNPPVVSDAPATPATTINALEEQAAVISDAYAGYGHNCNTDSCESSLSCKRDLMSSNSICCKADECAANGACPPQYSCSTTPKKLCYNGGWIDVLNYEVNCVDNIDNDCDGKIDTKDSDCPVQPVCGNNVCEASETKTTCPLDCGSGLNIIVRSDDIAPLWSTDNEIYLMEYIRNMSIPQTVGVIPYSNMGTIKLGDDTKLVNYLVSIKNDPLIEIGLHGFDHSVDEFLGIGQIAASSKITEGRNVLKNTLSVDTTTFLPPYYSYDENTLYGASDAGIKIFSAGWNAIDMGHGFKEYPTGLWNIPATTDIYDWSGQVLYSAQDIESSCENAMAQFGTCVIIVHHHLFVDQDNNIDPDKIAVLRDVMLWVKSKESNGVKLKTLGENKANTIPNATICEPVWVLNNTWSACINNFQIKNYYDSKNCNRTDTKPADLTGICNAPLSSIGVYRTLPKNASIGQELTVSLSVDVDETRKPKSYVLYETIPLGFDIIDTGGMQYTSSTRTLKLMVFESKYFGTVIQDRVITYKIKPANIPTMPFDGYIRLNGGNYNTVGDSQVSVGGG